MDINNQPSTKPITQEEFNQTSEQVDSGFLNLTKESQTAIHKGIQHLGLSLEQQNPEQITNNKKLTEERVVTIERIVNIMTDQLNNEMAGDTIWAIQKMIAERLERIIMNEHGITSEQIKEKHYSKDIQLTGLTLLHWSIDSALKEWNITPQEFEKVLEYEKCIVFFRRIFFTIVYNVDKEFTSGIKGWFQRFTERHMDDEMWEKNEVFGLIWIAVFGENWYKNTEEWDGTYSQEAYKKKPSGRYIPRKLNIGKAFLQYRRIVLPVLEAWRNQQTSPQ